MGNPRKTIKVAGMLALMTTSASMAAFVAAGAEPPDRPALHLALSNTQYSLCDSGDFYEHTHYTSDPSSEGFPAGELVQAFTEDVALAYSHAALSSIPDVDRAASQRLYELSASGRSLLFEQVSDADADVLVYAVSPPQGSHQHYLGILVLKGEGGSYLIDEAVLCGEALFSNPNEVDNIVGVRQ